MPIIELTTEIYAPVKRCFDLARSVELHQLSTRGTEEKAIGGVTSGLIGNGQIVTWRAKHFGVTQTLTSKITAFKRPFYFRDEMVEGVFKMICHDHSFEEDNDKTIMRDNFQFESPGGLFGVLFNKVMLEGYLRDLLLRRNQVIKEVAESNQWKKLLNAKG